MELDNVGKVSFLATGLELIQGDVINSNTAAMARLLWEKNIISGTTCVVSDDVVEISQALAFLFSNHTIVIVSGGLGPTSDDVTRFAVADYWGGELVFHPTCWQKITDRYVSRGMKVTENNRQQCLFPPGADILENSNGTADGCMLSSGSRLLVMLPGPPRECLPLFREKVLPVLQQKGLAIQRYQHRWLLFGVGEGPVADALESMRDDCAVEVGYRVCFPYLELKLVADSKKTMAHLISAIASHFASHIVGESQNTASQLLNEWLASHAVTINIRDEVTRGALQSVLASPQHLARLDFNGTQLAYDYHFVIEGLTRYWSGSDDHNDTVRMIRGEDVVVEEDLRLYGSRTIEWVKEWACWQILKSVSVA